MRTLLLLVLVGCSHHRGLDKGSACEATTSVVDATETTALGFSAQDALAQVAGPLSPTLVWTGSGAETTLTITVGWDGGEVRYFDNEPVEGDTGTADTGGMDTGGAGPCGDWMEIDVVLGFSSADGAFAESWALPIVVSAVDMASFEQDLDAVTLAGTFDKWDHADATADYETLGASVGGTLAPDGGSGQVLLIGSGWEDPDCRGEGCVAWASRGTVGEWGGDDTE